MTKPIAASSGVRSAVTGRKARGWMIVLRLFVVIGGGYAASSVLVAGLARALVPLGLARSDGVLLASMLGFVVYLLVLILGFSRQRLTCVVVDLLLIAGFGLLLATGVGI